ENLIQLQQKCFPSVKCFDLGPPSCLCHHCGAIMWLQESSYVTRNMMQPSFQLCCNEGGVTIPPLREPPKYLKSLIQSSCQNSHHFHKKIESTHQPIPFILSEIDRQLPAKNTTLTSTSPTFTISSKNYHVLSHTHLTKKIPTT
ncbi:hypothetical protein LINPERPRIM_LOCUS6555, partial [Linum perenne]